MAAFPGSMKFIAPGVRVKHQILGEGVVVTASADGYVRVFFQGGEHQIAVTSLTPTQGWAETVVRNAQQGLERNRKAWLAWQAHSMPLMESTVGLTSAKIDLLPHQVVLTHRVTTAAPRRFLIADEVGLGKTIETALILRELSSRGELRRALIIVPAGLVNNWHRELNEVFHLNFEVFGLDGDVTDRKSNAFSKHDRLIASVDTLKRKARIRKLTEAPLWDLIVFDEAHHLTATKSGGKIRKTENYKLAETLRERSRDMLLLSATPHQGDHFRFWMLIQLLDPTLFNSPEEMLPQRHRLNAIVARRTKADACKPNGSPLFARRWVHTESFLMSERERLFYAALNEYLQQGFALAKRQGNKGTTLGFVMSIFQKIAASSFAAVGRTLRRRLLALTVHESLVHEEDRDIERRDKLIEEARLLIRTELRLGADRSADANVDRALSDIQRSILKKLDEEAPETPTILSDEIVSAAAEISAADSVAFALPEERLHIKNLLNKLPSETETKVQKLLIALASLWRQDKSERIVIFATYLASVEMLADKISHEYPGQGVVVLKGGDHGTKAAAEKRFKQRDGPRVMICTAAGREGLNMQHARILFNFDLPWNPMDLEQRIGRIHRYGQLHTAQVYNLVLSDTIEGKIFLLLDDKLTEIAKTLGKLDEHGAVAEDLRAQILGQLSERLSYERLYAEALGDPELRRTCVELEAAMLNAAQAQVVVLELFQDLESFNISEYKALSDTSGAVIAVRRFLQQALAAEGKELTQTANGKWQAISRDGTTVDAQFVMDRDRAVADETLRLFGLDDPMIARYIEEYQAVPPDCLGLCVEKNLGYAGILSLWLVRTVNEKRHRITKIIAIAIDAEARRLSILEKMVDEVFQGAPRVPALGRGQAVSLLINTIEPMLHRDLLYRGSIREGQAYEAVLVGWIEVV